MDTKALWKIISAVEYPRDTTAVGVIAIGTPDFPWIHGGTTSNDIVPVSQEISDDQILSFEILKASASKRPQKSSAIWVSKRALITLRQIIDTSPPIKFIFHCLIHTLVTQCQTFCIQPECRKKSNNFAPFEASIY